MTRSDQDPKAVPTTLSALADQAAKCAHNSCGHTRPAATAEEILAVLALAHRPLSSTQLALAVLEQRGCLTTTGPPSRIIEHAGRWLREHNRVATAMHLQEYEDLWGTPPGEIDWRSRHWASPGLTVRLKRGHQARMADLAVKHDQASAASARLAQALQGFGYEPAPGDVPIRCEAFGAAVCVQLPAGAAAALAFFIPQSDQDQAST